MLIIMFQLRKEVARSISHKVRVLENYTLGTQATFYALKILLNLCWYIC